MNPAFFGKWTVDKSRSTGKEGFAKAMGISADQYAMFDKMDVSVTISKEGDGYKFEADFKGAAPAVSYVAIVGKPVEVPSFDGTKAQLTMTISGDTVKEVYKLDKGNWTVTRTVSGKEQRAVSESGGAKMTHILIKE